MKKCITVLLAVVLTACTVEENITSYVDNSSPMSRSPITDESETNPTLMTDWENVDKIILCNGRKIDVPWSQGTSLLSVSEFAKDVKKEDGWVMLYHTFKALNTYPKVNYIALYNRLTGFLKFFYYQEGSMANSNGGMWYYQTSDGIATSLFNLNDYVALPNNASQRYNFVATSNISTNAVDGFKDGWNGFEIEVPYTTDYVGLPFTLSTYSQRIVKHEYAGLGEAETTGVITKTVKKENGLFKAISSISGMGAKQIVNALKKQSDNNVVQDGTGAVKGKLGTKVINALSKVTTGDYKSAISGGLKYLFGSNTSVDTARVNLTTNAKVTLSGQSSEITVGGPITLGLVELHEAVERAIGEDAYLGVWTLSAAPEVKLFRYSKVNVLHSIPGENYSVINKGMLYFPYSEVSNLNIQINPALSPYIKARVVTSEIFIADRMDGQTIPARFNYVGMGDLIYSDSLQTTYELPVSFYDTSELSGYCCVDGYDSFYDWGTSAPQNLYLAVTVELTYDYNGKSKTYLSSRIYKANAVMHPDERMFATGANRKAFIVNTGVFPLEDRVLMNDYKKVKIKSSEADGL